MNFLSKNTQKLTVTDIAFTKLAVMFFVLFLFSYWPGFRFFVESTNPVIYLFGWIIFALKPLYRFFK